MRSSSGSMVSSKAFESFTPLLSVTCTVNVVMPFAVGVPVRLPAASSVRPAGSPLADHW